MTKEEKNTIILKLTPLIKKHGGYIQTIFDLHQTHAIYSCTELSLFQLKPILKKLGANKFRLVKNNGLPILCFNGSKINFQN